MKYDLDRGDYLIKNGKKVYRCIAKVDIPIHGVKAGDKGGYIQYKKNLSQKGKAWIGERAIVMDGAYVSGNALVDGDAILTGNVVVKGNARIGGNTEISGNVQIFGNARIDNVVPCWKDSPAGPLRATRNAENEPRYTKIIISGESKIFDDVVITGNTIVKNAVLFGKLKLYGYSSVIGRSGRIHDNGTISLEIGVFSPENLSFKKRGLIIQPSKSSKTPSIVKKTSKIHAG